MHYKPVDLTLLSLSILACLAVLLGGSQPQAVAEQIGPDDFRISFSGPDSTSDTGAQSPAVAYNPDAREYFVVWQAITTSTTITQTVMRNEIVGQRINAATGARLGSPILISQPDPDPLRTYAQELPAVVYNGADRRYFVVWAYRTWQASAAIHATLGRFVDAQSGAPLGIDSFWINERAGTGGNNIFDESRLVVGYSPASRRYLLVVSDQVGSPEFRVYGQMLAADGARVGSELSFSAPLPNGLTSKLDVSPALAYNPQADEFLVTWIAATYWYIYERGATFLFAQRVSAASGDTVGLPVLIAGSNVADLPPPTPAPLAAPGGLEGIQTTTTPIPITSTIRPGLPAVGYHAGSNAYLIAWVEGRYYDFPNSGPAMARWVRANGEPVDAKFALPSAGGCEAGHISVSPVSSPGVLGVAWAPSELGGSAACALGTQVSAVWLRGLQQTGLGSAELLSQMGPAGGLRFRAFRPVMVMGSSSAEALAVWAGNDEAPGLNPARQEVFGQFTSALTVRLVLPQLQRDFIPPFDGQAEREPNNSATEANGPLVSGQALAGFPNDNRDYYRLTISRAGAVTVELNGMTASGAQLQLLDQALNRVGYDGDTPYRIDLANVAPGTYYVYIFAAGNFNTTTPYTLRATFP